ncbi:MAG: choice-of-anchor D domain-containing protein, partial [Nevskiaceae bacterium]
GADGTASAARTGTLPNSSRVALPISELKIAGTHSVDYAQTNDCGDTLAAASSCRVAVIFKPTATGSRFAEVSLSSSALAKPLTVTLTGSASGNSVAVSRIQSIDVSGAGAFILAQDSRSGALARASRRGLRLNVGPLDEIAIEEPRLYKVEGDEEPVEISFKDNEGKVITQDEVTVVGIIDLENYVITKLKDSNGVVDFLVDKTTGAAYKSTGLEWSDPKVLANGDIVARRGSDVFFIDVGNLGSGALRAKFLPSIDAIKEFEVSDTDGFLVYSGTNKNSGRSACRVVDLRKKDGESGRLRDAADFVPEGATSRWDNCLWFWHPTERAIYFADYQDYVAGLRRDSIDYIRIQRNSAGELVKGQRLNFSCVAPNRGEFAQPRLAYFSMCTHSIGRSAYLRSRGQWVAGRYVYGQEYMWPAVVDVENRQINHLDTLNESVCSNCGNDDTWWYKTFASDNFVWMFGLDRNTSRDIVGQLDLDTGQTRSIRINEVDVAEIFPLSDGKILFKGDRLSDVSKVVGTLSVNGDVFVNEVYPYITAAGAEIVPVNPDSAYTLLRYKVTVVAGEGGIVTPASADVLIDRTASFVLTPTAGFEVDTAAGCGGKRSGNSYTTGKVTAECTVNVTFKKRDNTNANSVDLTVIKTGDGTIKSTPAGIDCGTTCAVAFEKNKPVTLVATPGAGQTFSGWGGACSGTARSCTVSMAEAAGVTAAFAAAGSGPRLVLGTASLSFGAIAVGARSAAQDVTLANEGSAPLSLNGLTLSGIAAEQFTQANNCGKSIAVGASCTVSLIFAPASEGVKRAELTISSNAGAAQQVALEGTGTPAPQVSFDAPSVSYGDVDLGQSGDRTVTLTNTGGADLVITAVGLSGNNADQFARTTTCTNANGKLAAGARCTIAIKFKPGTAGSKSALLVIDSNAPNSPSTLALRGTAVGPQVSIEATPKVVTPGGKARLSWSSNVMTRCSASGAWSGTRELSGSIETPALSESARFVLTCEGPLGSRTDETEVLVSSNLATAVSLSVKGAPVAGVISTFAGTGPSRFNGDAIAASGAGLNRPHAIATDNLGNLFIADSDNHRIRRVDAVTGVIATVAGFGEGGYTGDGAAATEALLNSPHGVAVDSSGTLYIADTGNHRIRRVTAAGVITTIAGTGQQGYSGDGGAATRAQFNSPSDVVIDGPGALLVVERMNHRVRRIDLTTGVIATIAGTGEAGFSGDGGPATLARLNQPWHAVIDRAGDVLIADKDNQRVRKITRSSGVITTVAGDGSRGGEPTKSIAEPAGLAVTADGSVYVADGAWCFVRKLVPGSTNMEVVAGCDYNVFGSVYGMAVDRSGGLLLAELVNSRIRRLDLASKLVTTVAGDRPRGFTGDGDAATLASLRMPHGLARDSRGNLYVADWENRRVRRIDAVTNVITTVLGDLWAIGLATDSADNLYVADHYGNRIWRVDTRDGSSRVIAGIGEEGFSGDGGPATAARLRRPYAIVIDSNGNVIFTEQESRRIRKITSSGTISTIAGDGEWGFSGDGGPAAFARLSFVRGLASDADGNLYLADRGNNRIRRIDTTGVISTVAGNGAFSSTGDN